MNKPCPNCGYCPCCGRANHRLWGTYPEYPWPQKPIYPMQPWHEYVPKKVEAGELPWGEAKTLWQVPLEGDGQIKVTC